MFLSLFRRTPADRHTRTTQALWEDVDEARHLLENGAAGAHGGLSGQSHLSTSSEPVPLRRHGTFNISYFLVAGFQTTPSVTVTAGHSSLTGTSMREEPLGLRSRPRLTIDGARRAVTFGRSPP